MSLDFIHRFQLQIHQILTQNEPLREHVRQIHLSVIDGGNYPFIMINILHAENNSLPSLSMYLVEFEICIFSKEPNKKSLITISNLVAPLLLPRSIVMDGYTVAGIRLNNLVFNDAKDLLHNKLAMCYKAIIKKS